MRSRAVRVTLTLLAAGTLAAAAYLFWNIDRRAARLAANARAVETRVSTAVRQTFDLRGAQQSYVSAGQSEQFWIAKVTASLAALRDSLTALQSASATASGRVALDGALQALQEFERMDRRAREYSASEQKLLASDLIFSDGLENTEEIITALEQTRYVEAEDAAAARAAARREQLMFAGGGAAVALVALILLTPVPPRVTDEPETGQGHADASPADFDAAHAGKAGRDDAVPDPVEEFEFRPLARPGAALPPAADSEPVAAVPASVPALATEPVIADPAPDLVIVAEVCSDLARVADTASLPSLLERTATALGASGVMLWVADPDGQELTAIAAHGYPANMLSRMGTIKKDAENVTAAAFRTGLLQTLRADATSPGAIAAPLVNPSGCMGVMSAEVRHDGERQPARLAIATIVAAQLATLVAPATRAHVKSEAV